MEPVGEDPATDPPSRRRGLRVGVVAAVVVAVWASMWAIGRSALTTPAPTAPPASPQAAGQGTRRAPPTFSPALGWSVWTSGALTPDSRDVPIALAANVPPSGMTRSVLGAKGLTESGAISSLRTLPRDGIAIIALLPFPAGLGPAPPHFGDFPDRGWPLQLADARINRQWQSQPRPNAPEYDVWGRVEGTYVEVSVYFGTPRLSPGAFAVAQSELNRLILPGVPAGYAPTLAWTAQDAGPLTIQTPPGWTFAANPVPGVTPEIWFALGTWAFPRGGTCGPQAALRFLPRNGALVWVSDAGSPFNPADVPRKPARFTLRGRRAALHDCSGNKPSYVIRFRDRGRAFQAQIAFGPDASAGTRAEALRSLSSLRVGSEAG